jgi:sirohydrochlorin cobaltochelatase
MSPALPPEGARSRLAARRTAPRVHQCTDGLVLFAHGARDPAWARPFEAVAAEVLRVQPALALRLAFLEFMSPDLHEAGRQLAAEGCTRVQVLPLFLGTGGHLRKDLPPMIEQLRSDFPGVAWAVLPAAGEHSAVVLALADVALAALHSDEATPVP